MKRRKILAAVIVLIAAGAVVAVWKSQQQATTNLADSRAEDAQASAPTNSADALSVSDREDGDAPTVRQSAEEAQRRANALAGACDKTVLTDLDLSRVPTEGELIAAGNLGDPLSPTAPTNPQDIRNTAKRKLTERENMSFGHAIQAWNQHRYDEAYEMFVDHLMKFPEGAWAEECKLHLGCFCQYRGRFQEAATWFEDILASTGKDHDIFHKARLRRSALHLDQGNLDLAEEGFASMKRDDLDPNRQTYASTWIREISMRRGQEVAMRDCGQKALARVCELRGDDDAAKRLKSFEAAGAHGFTAKELVETARNHRLSPQAVRSTPVDLGDLPLPFVAHYNDEHYVTVEAVEGGDVRLFDSRVGTTTGMSENEFAAQWSGFAVIFEDGPKSASVVGEEELDRVVGGCCGIARPGRGIGRDTDEDCEKDNCGLPGWHVNKMSMNMRVTDTPMWWDPPYGPRVYMTLTFNSLDSLNNFEPFGEKWAFAYASYLLIDPSNGVTVRDGDGCFEYFTDPNPQATLPKTLVATAGDFRELTQTGASDYLLEHPNGDVMHYGPAFQGSSIPQLLSITDRHQNTVSVVYNAQGAVTAIQHSALAQQQGQPTRQWGLNYAPVALDAGGTVSRVANITDPFGRTCTFSYDGEGNLVGQEDMGGIAYSYAYTNKQAEVDDLDDQTGQITEDVLRDELFMTGITTPRGTTGFFTQPADGDDYYGLIGYPPSNAVSMWENYRITVTDQEGYASEYHYDGYDSRTVYRNAAQYDPAITSVQFKNEEWSGVEYKLDGGASGAPSRIR